MQEVINHYYIMGGLSARAINSRSIEISNDTSTDLTYDQKYNNALGGVIYNLVAASLLGPSDMCMGLLHCYNKGGTWSEDDVG